MAWANTYRLLELLVYAMVTWFAITCFTSCGRISTKPIVVDAVLSTYAQAFELDVGASTANISMSFEPLAYPIIGYCTISSEGDRSIAIDPAFWSGSRMTDLGKEQLMYHELGHCALGQAHLNDYVGSPEGFSLPGSIMNAYWFGDQPYYQEYRSEYLLALKRNSLIAEAESVIVNKQAVTFIEKF